jgi:site-specific DNA-methyltransferase (cytosine-N4-specific)
MFLGPSEEVLASEFMRRFRKRVQLIFTSPPFPLNRKKKYGNLQGDLYSEWLASFAPIFKDFLKEDGSIVIELGNAWEPGKPVMSNLALKSLLAFQERGELNICQQFVAYNKARLPGPAQWVNVERIRVKDSYTNVWWMAPSERPKADNNRVLKQYSPAMLHLLESGKYSSGKRPSEHKIGKKSFLKDNQGAIPSNVLVVSNTLANDDYMAYCKKWNKPLHPARMPKDLPDFFIRFLTDPGDIVMDPFAGSNVTGWSAEKLGRRWISIEKDRVYGLTSRSRFAGTIANSRRRYPK